MFGVNMAAIGAFFSGEEDGRYWASLPDEVKEQVNAHAEEFHSAEDIRAFIRRLELKA